MAEKNEKKKRETKAYMPKRSCPKCGVVSKLAEHKDRRTCGRCGYMEKK